MKELHERLGTTPFHQWVVQRTKWNVKVFIKGQKCIDHDKERTQELCIIFDKRCIKKTFLSPCITWQNKVVSWDGRQPCRWILDGTDFSTPGHQRCLSSISMWSKMPSLPSPANVKTWNKHRQCSLCGYNCCTMLHNWLLPVLPKNRAV